MAMASASAVSSGFGTSRRHKSRRVISITCGFKALPYPVTANFTCTGVYIPVSRLSVAVSAVLGVPGVTLLVLLSLL